MSHAFSLIARLKSFRYALAGIGELLKSQHNAWVHLGVTVGVVVAAFYFRINQIEWCIVIFAIVIVWVAEALNTALEFLCDHVSSEFHPLIKKSKDVAAGAVLLSAIGAVVIGVIIFGPYIKSLTG
ncbi:diacylglycerol kinase family protein [Aliikangiella maris]|uniref:Diacylglycerol kinase family protein n=2 Tax=Aliikangiella maris TaxID=3162458 RepID=A0ABV3MRA0_9GAMM